jgi:quinoprotein glucose dehydrogenase
MPGNSGGANWGSTAADPEDGLFYVLTKNEPTVLKLEKVVPGVASPGAFPTEVGFFVYRQNCQLCHLANREGQPPMTPSLTDVLDRLSAEEIRAVVREGRATMPGFIDLSDDDINGIIAYLRFPEFAPTEEDLVEDENAPLRYKTGYGYFTSSIGWAIKPPWMTMTAYDLNTGDIQWQIPVGDADSLVVRGITGSGAVQLRGGPTITESGLVFMATGNTFRAYDQDSGEEIWSTEAPSAIEGIPAVYEVAGRQYVVVGAGGGGFGAGSPGAARAYVAFALP